MADIDETKSWMRWWGWTNDGGPGAIKIDADEQPIAYHGDPTWHADVDKAYELARVARASSDKDTSP
ncbi:hypothetical protein AB6806_27720 [Bosea sp. RCC_152_1]|uniref:hypothetical protein n=1 Tax=Bosea sp. RCC_152_1 TaxID=3239228 RepID=UPI0035269322